MKLNGVIFLLQLLYFVFADEKLYYYGAPFKTASTGFIKFDPYSNAWEPAAQGFATTSVSGGGVNVQGSLIGAKSLLLYGNFNLWNNSYVGGLLQLDLDTLQPSILNSGVIGDVITGATYFNNGSQIAFIGSFMYFQQSPTQPLNNVGACSSDGKVCYALGNGFSDLYLRGSIRSIGSVLYALYYDDEGFAVVAKFDTHSSASDWESIYSSTYLLDNKSFSIEIFQGDLWLFGNISTSTQTEVSAARWNSTENSWEYMYTSTVPEFLTLASSTSCSPDGNSVYLQNILSNGDVEILQWNDSTNDWTQVASATCMYSPVMTALNDGFLLACGYQVTQYPAGQILPNLTCDGGPTIFSVSADSSEVFALCQYISFQTISYNLTNLSVTASSDIADFEQLSFYIYWLCPYGEKLAVAGSFSSVGGVPADTFAIWDNKYQRWYALSQTPVFGCACGYQETQMAAVCVSSTEPSFHFLILDSSTSDSGSSDSIQNVQTYNLSTLPTDTAFIHQVKFLDDWIYFSTVIGTSGLELYRWSSEQGLENVFSTYGQYFLFDFRGDIVYLAGMITFENNVTTAVSAARFNLSSSEWLTIDQTYRINGNQVLRGFPYALAYWDYVDQVYIGGEFSRIGDLKVSNWGARVWGLTPSRGVCSLNPINFFPLELECS